MKTIFLLFLLIFPLTQTTIFADTGFETKPVKLYGKVIDGAGDTKLPLEYATISVYSNDSSLVTGVITGSDGSFELGLKPGKYDIKVQFVSYETKTIENIDLNGENASYNLGSISLHPQSESIEEAVIVGEKSEMVMGLDRKIFNVGKDLSNAGKSASEIIDNIPSVTVDVDGNVSLRGSQNIQILIDGKPSGLVSAENSDALRNLQGSLIDRIEVITNPGATYEAKGLAGIINIVLKKDQQKGVNGSFDVSVGQPSYYSLGANVNFRRKKINYFLNYGLNYNERPGSGKNYQVFTLADTSYITRIERDRLRTGWSHTIRGGADYFINSKNTLTTSLLLGFDNDYNTTDLWYRDYTIDDVLKEVSLRQDHEDETEHNIELSLNYTKTFDRKDRKLTVFTRYLDDYDLEESGISQTITALQGEAVTTDPRLQKVRNKEVQKNMLLQADYVQPFGEGGKFETGYRSEFRNITNPYTVSEKNDAGEWNTLAGFTNNLNYQENIHAAYIQIGNKFNALSIQLGLRTEISDVSTYLRETDSTNNNFYIDLFPSVHFTYELNDNQSMQLSYSRRINRPGFWLLNPFYSYSDERNIFSGNPNVKPEYTQSFEGGYLFKNEHLSIYAGLYFRHSSQVFERISNVDSITGLNYIIPVNLSTRQSYGTETNISVDLFQWWKFSGDLNFFRNITSGTYLNENLSSDSYSWNSRLNSKWSFKNNFDLQANFFYRAPLKTTQGTRQAFYMLDMGISKDVLNRNGTFTLNIRDLLNSRKFRFILDSPELYSENEFRWSTRSVSLTFTYRLNQLKKANGGQRNNGDTGGDGMIF